MATIVDTVKHGTAARGALWWIAWICLGASAAFWFNLFWAVLLPPVPLSQQSIAAIAMGLIYTLVLPLLCSMLVPTTPAGQLLQRTQWATIGFWVVAGATIFLSWHAWTMLSLWWLAQPLIEQTDQARWLSIASIIGFVLVPAAAWVQVSPDRWLIEIEQWRQVKRIERMAQLEDLAYKAMIARTRAILNAELAGRASERFPELAGMLLTSERITRTALAAIADSFHDMYGVEVQTGLEDDRDLAARYRRAVAELTTAADMLPPLRDVTPHEVSERVTPEHVQTRLQSSESRQGVSVPDSTVLSGTPLYTPEITAARQELSAIWTAQELAGVLKVEKRAAQKTIATWKQSGLITEGRIGRYSFTEMEA